MDFVVVGFGLGAVMMLAGFALRDLGPWLFGSNVSANSLPEFETVKTTIRKQTLSSIGAGIATAGTGLALVTFAALMARTEDDLGTIVVGMSLALAAVGVGAWTYDAIRRYRAAMEVVSHQERAVHARLHPAPSSPKTRPTQAVGTLPTTADGVTTDDHEPTIGPDPDEEADLQAASSDDQPVEELTEPEDVGQAGEVATEFDASNTDDDPIVGPEIDLDHELAASEQWDADESPAEVEPESEPTPRNDLFSAMSARWNHTTKSGATSDAKENDADQTADSVPARPESPNPLRWPSISRSAAASRERPHQQDDALILPPLPDEHHDELIDESVRFDMRSDNDRNVPSWLFEDLEHDLTGGGTSRPEDPIDQFRDSKPHQRGSALDRILAGDSSSDDDEDGDNSTLPASKRRSEDESD